MNEHIAYDEESLYRTDENDLEDWEDFEEYYGISGEEDEGEIKELHF